jgi:hypothetical protein
MLKRECDSQNAEEVAAKPTGVEQQMLKPVRIPTATRDPRPLPSASNRKETNYAPPENWPSFWKQAFKEHPRLFDPSSSEGKPSNLHIKSRILMYPANPGSSDEEYFKEGDPDAGHGILVPILPTDEPLWLPVDMEKTTKPFDQPLEPAPPILVPPISPVVLSTPPFHSSPSLILTDWTLTPPHRLRTRSGDMDTTPPPPDKTTQEAVLGDGSVDLEGKANISTSGESSSRFIEEGIATSSFLTYTEQSSTSNGHPLEVNEAEDCVLVLSSNQTKSGRQRPVGAGSLRRLQLSPRRIQRHRGELRSECSTSHTIPMHPTKRNPTLKYSQPLFSQPQATSIQEPVSASVETTSQGITSSESIRIPPGQVPVARESQESRSTLKSIAPESPIEAFVDIPSWEITSSESIKIPPSGEIAVTQESQEASARVQNMGEVGASFKTLDPLTNRDHRWKSKNINAMLSSSPIYPTPSGPNSPETSMGPVDIMSDGDIAYHQYMEDNLKAKAGEGLPTSCEEGTGSQLEIDDLDGMSSKASSADESDEETDHKKEEPNKQSGITAGEEDHTQQLFGDVVVDEQQKPSQGALKEQEVGILMTPGSEAPLTQNETRVEESVQPVREEEPQESAHIEVPDTKDNAHQNQIHERLARTPIQEPRTDPLREPRAEEAEVRQWEAEILQAEAHKGNEMDYAIGAGHEAENHGKESIARVLASDAGEMKLAVESTALLETSCEELQNIGLQQGSSRIHSHSPPARFVPGSLHRPEPRVSKARAPRRLPWLLAGPDGSSPSAIISSPPLPPKQVQVLGKRKRMSVGDDIREQARTRPPSSVLGMPANTPDVLLQLPIPHQGVIKRRKVDFIDTPLKIDFESGSDSDEIPITSRRPQRKRNEKALTIQVRDGSPFSRNEPIRPPSFDVPSPLPPVNPPGPSIPGGQKVQSSRPTVYAHQPALSVVSSSSARDHRPTVLPVHRQRHVSVRSNAVRQRPTHPVSSRALTRYPSPISSLFREDRGFSRRPSAAHSLSSYIDHSDFSEVGDDTSTMSTNTLPYVDFLKRG